MRKQLPEASTDDGTTPGVSYTPGLEAVLFRNIRDLTDDEKLQIARDYVRTTNLNIASFLRNKPHLTVRLEHIQEDFRLFWHHIQATGNLEEAIGSLTTPHNTGDENELQKPIVPHIQKAIHHFLTTSVLAILSCKAWFFLSKKASR